MTHQTQTQLDLPHTHTLERSLHVKKFVNKPGSAHSVRGNSTKLIFIRKLHTLDAGAREEAAVVHMRDVLFTCRDAGIAVVDEDLTILDCNSMFASEYVALHGRAVLHAQQNVSIHAHIRCISYANMGSTKSTSKTVTVVVSPLEYGYTWMWPQPASVASF